MAAAACFPQEFGRSYEPSQGTGRSGHPSAHQILRARVPAWAMDQTVVGR